MTLRVLLVDDHEMFRQAVSLSLAEAPGIQVVAEAADGAAALAALTHSTPDVVCLDVNLPGQDGIELTRELLARRPELRVIGLSAHADPLLVARMLHAGAMGYVSKSRVGQDLQAAIRQVGQNQSYLGPDFGQQVALELMRLAG
jgi:DNA-binding NarL/FixJ family response regulator